MRIVTGLVAPGVRHATAIPAAPEEEKHCSQRVRPTLGELIAILPSHNLDRG